MNIFRFILFVFCLSTICQPRITADLRSIKVLYDQWMVFSDSEETWMRAVKREDRIVKFEENPDKMIEKAENFLIEGYEVKPRIQQILCFYGNGDVGSGKIEVYQVKIFFFLTNSVKGTPLCESMLVRSDGEILLQRR